MQRAKRARRRARILAVQALYQVEVAGVSPAQAVRTARRLAPTNAVDDAEVEPGARENPAPNDESAADELEYAALLAGYAWSERHRVDALISGTSTRWRLSRLGRLEVQVLRVAAAEMLRCPEVPPPVVIDEAIELARSFAGDEAARFVNGVADAMARQLAAERGVAMPERPAGAERAESGTSTSAAPEDSDARASAGDESGGVESAPSPEGAPGGGRTDIGRSRA